MYYTENPVSDFDRWEMECYFAQQKLPRCSKCGGHVSEYYLIGDDRVVCRECAGSWDDLENDVLYCEVCGKEITKEPLVVDGKCYCEKCHSWEEWRG